MNDANAFAIYRYQVYLLEGKGRDEKTVDAALHHIWRFCELTGDVDFRCINIEQIVQYKTSLQASDNSGKTLSASTIVHAFSSVCGFFRWLRKQVGYDKIPEDLVEYFSAPQHLIQIANAPVEKAYPTHEEVIAVVGSMPTDSFRQRRNRALVGSCPGTWCSFGTRHAFRTEPGMGQLAAGRLMSGSSLIVAIVSRVM